MPAPPLTFEWHLRLGLQEKPLAARDPGLPNVIAQGVAPVGPAVKAASLVKHLHVFAPIAGDLLLAVSQGVNKEMNRPLVGTLHRLGQPCREAEGWN